MDPSFSPGIDLFRTFATLATLAGAVDQPEDGCRYPVPGPEVFGPAPGPPSPEVAFCRAGSGPVLGLALQPEILEVDEDQSGRAGRKVEEQGPQGPTGRRRPTQGSGHGGPQRGPFGPFEGGGLGIERTPPGPVADVEAGPPGGEQGEVVRGDRRQGVRWGVGEGVVGFGRELMDVGPEHPVAAHGGPDGGCHRTQVLAPHGHAGPGGLPDADSPEL